MRFQRFFISDGRLDESNTPRTWREIGQAILNHFDSSASDIDDLREALSRPHDQFPIQWQEGWNLRLPQVMIARNFSRSIALRSLSHALAGHEHLAYEDLDLALKLTHLGTAEFLSSRYIESSNLTEALDALRLAQEQHIWDDKKWEAIKERLDRYRYRGAVSKGFRIHRMTSKERMDRFFASNLYEFLRPRMFFSSLKLPIDWNDPIAKSTFRTLDPLLRPIILATWMVEWRRKFELYGKYIDKAELVEKTSHTVPWASLPRIYEPESGLKTSVLYLGFSDIDKSLDMMFTAETTARLASLSCSLERFYVEHQQYPDSLEALIPSFLAKTPIDPMNGRTWNYQPNDNLRGYKLYSIGKKRHRRWRRIPHQDTLRFQSQHG